MYQKFKRNSQIDGYIQNEQFGQIHVTKWTKLGLAENQKKYEITRYQSGSLLEECNCTPWFFRKILFAPINLRISLEFLVYTGCGIRIWTTFRGPCEDCVKIFSTFKRVSLRYDIKQPKNHIFPHQNLQWPPPQPPIY